jgi:hypothetical protein
MNIRARMFFLTVVSALTYSACASAAIFEMQHLTPDATTPASKINPLGSSKSVLHQAASISYRGDLLFPSVKFALARPEDLLWAAIGEANLFGTQFSPPDADPTLYLVGTEHLLVQNTGHGSASRAPTDSTAPETWAVILIGAGLIWSQLRRKTRHSAIRFTAP